MPEAESGNYRRLGLQLGRFAVVGVVATFVHVLAYVASVGWWGQAPVIGNALGFVLGVNVSFLGHRRWTFAASPALSAGRTLARFWIVALIGFALNTLFVQLVTGTAGLGYGWAIPFIAGVTPALTFVLSKAWAFQD